MARAAFASTWQIFVPMSTSVIIMTSLLTFLASWNSFLQPLVYISKWEMMTLPLGLKALNGMQNTGSVSVVLAGVHDFPGSPHAFVQLWA